MREVPVYLVSEFAKDNWGIRRDMFDKTGTWINFPEIEAPTIVASLSNSSVRVEVVSSSIFVLLPAFFSLIRKTSLTNLRSA